MADAAALPITTDTTRAASTLSTSAPEQQNCVQYRYAKTNRINNNNKRSHEIEREATSATSGDERGAKSGAKRNEQCAVDELRERRVAQCHNNVCDQVCALMM